VVTVLYYRGGCITGAITKQDHTEPTIRPINRVNFLSVSRPAEIATTCHL